MQSGIKASAQAELFFSGLNDANDRLKPGIEALQEAFAKLSVTALQAQAQIGVAVRQIASAVTDLPAQQRIGAATDVVQSHPAGEQLFADAGKSASESWEHAIRPIEDKFGSFVADIIMRTQSVGAALEATARSLIGDLLKSVSRGLLNALLFGDAGPNAGGLLAGLFGTILSPSGLLAGLFGFARGGIVPSARGGWSVPTLGPGGMLAQVHSQEMVLPAHISQGLQEMIANSGNHTFNIGISAIDAPSVQRLFMAHGSALVAALNRAMRNGSMLYRPT